MTHAEFQKLRARLHWNPVAEAMLLWPFGWGVFSVGLMWVFSGWIFAPIGAGTFVSLEGVGAALVVGGVLSALACWALGTRRATMKNLARAMLKQAAKDARGIKS